jgi:membrane protease YdiL (CAAX protease family)
MLLDWIDLVRVILVGAILGVVVGWVVARRPFHIERLRPRYWLVVARRMKLKDWAKLIAIALGVAVVSILVSKEIVALLTRAEVPHSTGELPIPTPAAEEPLRLPLVLANLVFINVLPIFEEWIFRAIFIDETLRWRRSKLLAIVLSTVIFAFIHLSNPGSDAPSVIILIPGGLLLGACYLYTGLGGAILAHNIYNTYFYLTSIGFLA